MTPLLVTLRLRSPLGTPLAGDTLFGQLCHIAREMFGEAELDRLLRDYTAGAPWLVISDGFPGGYLPRPTVPAAMGVVCDSPALRKEAKGKRWVPHASVGMPLRALLDTARSDSAVYGNDGIPVSAAASHNTINRMTGTTGTGEFAPYTQPQIFHQSGQLIDLWCLLDETRLARNILQQLFEHLGSVGYGRDASIGLGKFDVDAVQETNLFKQNNPRANAWWTLAPCAPQAQGFDETRSYWRVLTRFGRHGGTLALGSNPFKRPLLLAATGAVFASPGTNPERLFIGKGLGGVSSMQQAAVHQGYAPVIGVQIEDTP